MKKIFVVLNLVLCAPVTAWGGVGSPVFQANLTTLSPLAVTATIPVGQVLNISKTLGVEFGFGAQFGPGTFIPAPAGAYVFSLIPDDYDADVVGVSVNPPSITITDQDILDALLSSPVSIAADPSSASPLEGFLCVNISNGQPAVGCNLQFNMGVTGMAVGATTFVTHAALFDVPIVSPNANEIDNIQVVASAPVPATFGLLAIGLAGIVYRRRSVREPGRGSRARFLRLRAWR